jgi:hypothetical protein
MNSDRNNDSDFQCQSRGALGRATPAVRQQ